VASYLFVTWDGGGNVPPAVAIADELRRRGHRVAFVAHETQRPALEEPGFEVEPATHARPFAASDGVSAVAMARMFGDRGLGRDALAAVERRDVDLVVVDCLLLGAMEELRGRAPYVVLQHLYDAYFRGSFLRGAMGVGLRLQGLRVRASLAGARATLAASLPSLDPSGRTVRDGLTWIGPVVSGRPRTATDPAVLVSLSTFGYDGMTERLQRILDATAGLDTRVVVTTGPHVDVTRFRTSANHELHTYLAHDDVMPEVSLVVGHGGHGTTMRALAHDLPLVVIPLYQHVDQTMVGQSVERAGAGRVLSRKAGTEVVRAAVADLLADGPHRAAAARLGAEIRALPGVRLGADRIEEVTDGAGAPGRPSARP
jgi:UDP:flavonoid glycosyltransferase YjiC (YdhE family)